MTPEATVALTLGEYTPTTHTLTVTTREYALISAAIHASERVDRRAGDTDDADEYKALRLNLAAQMTKKALA